MKLLETHLTDLAILSALDRMRHGGTVEEIHSEVSRVNSDSLSIDTIKRHLPGLLKMRNVQRDTAVRENRPVFIWRKSGERVAGAENAGHGS